MNAENRGGLSNHPDLQEPVSAFEVPYFHVPVEKDGKAKAEQRILEVTSITTVL